MNARRELNSANLAGGVPPIGHLGAVTDSWFALVFVLLGLLASNAYLSEVRPFRGRK